MFKNLIQAIEDDYDANNDLGPGPKVTSTDFSLLILVKELLKRVESLEKELNELKQRG